MAVLLYIQLHGESKEKGGKTHGAESIIVEGPKGCLACLENSGGQEETTMSEIAERLIMDYLKRKGVK